MHLEAKQASMEEVRSKASQHHGTKKQWTLAKKYAQNLRIKTLGKLVDNRAVVTRLIGRHALFRQETLRAIAKNATQGRANSPMGSAQVILALLLPFSRLCCHLSQFVEPC